MEELYRMELTIKKRKIFAKVIILIILLIIIGILIWQFIYRDKISTYELDRNNSINLVEEFGHGDINEKDTFYVKKGIFRAKK